MALIDQINALATRIGTEIKEFRAAPVVETATATAAAVTITRTPAAGKRLEVTQITFAYDTAPTGGLVTLTIDGTSSSLPITSAGPGPIPVGAQSIVDGSVSVALASGGAGVEGTLWLHYKEV